ncbi:MAG TPA: dephospho-CoA kinase, partial [Burkholderiales bacterium]|nr:dephospho-CoA kinase [Burkholderiales bacterium]
MARFGIALTGGIGSGKSTVASIFSKLGIEVIDTDQISHFLTSNNGPAIEKIVEAFGAGFVRDGNLDRPK